MEQRRRNKLLEKVSSFINSAVCVTEDGVCLGSPFSAFFKKALCLLLGVTFASNAGTRRSGSIAIM